MGYMEIDLGYVIRTYWPVILILAGLKNVLEYNKHPYGRSISIGNLILIAVGGYFLARNLHVIVLSPGDFFRYLVPTMLIIAGLYVILKPRNSSKSYHDPSKSYHDPSKSYHETSNYSSFDPTMSDADMSGMHSNPNPNSHSNSHSKNTWKEDHGWSSSTVNKSGFIGDLHLGSDYFELRPTNVSHFIGDTVIDLTKASIPYGETKITISSFMGDVKVYVPNDLEVGVAVTCSAFHGEVKVLDHYDNGFMKNIQQQTPFYGDASKKVRIIVSTFLGDVKVNKVG
jgi:lia operon protein LiaF